MEKQKVIYRYCRYDGKTLLAKKEVPYEIKLSSRLILDKLCFTWNKEKLQSAIDYSIDTGNKKEFLRLSDAYRQFIWE